MDASADPRRCPECDFELLYVRASRMRAYAIIGEEQTISLHVTDAIICSRCGWWRQATADDQPALWPQRPRATG